jgi:hypothetical protein
MCLCFQFPCVADETGTPQPPSGNYTFKWDGSGRTGGKGGIDVSFSRYKSNGGVSVERSVEHYESSSQAQVGFSNLVGRARQVVERGHKKAWDGRDVGNRVRLMLRDPNGDVLHVIAWTDGSRVFVLRSKSLTHLIDFERQDYPSSAPKPSTSNRRGADK